MIVKNKASNMENGTHLAIKLVFLAKYIKRNLLKQNFHN